MDLVKFTTMIFVASLPHQSRGGYKNLLQRTALLAEQATFLAALGVAFAVVPYCVAKAVSEMNK